MLECRQERHVRIVLQCMNVSCEDGKSELLQARVFALLMGETYRSHNDRLYECVDGAWGVSQQGISIMALESILDALRRAQVYFLAMAKHNVERTWEAVVLELRLIHAVPNEESLLEWQLTDILGKKATTKARQWCAGASELIKELRRQFGEHNKRIVTNFHRWAESSMEEKMAAGLCFLEAWH